MTKQDIRAGVNLHKRHVVISRPYTKGSVLNGRKEVLYSSTGDEITTRGYRVLTSAECTTIMIAELAVTSGLGSFFD
jgi:hypothetical protein